jgi:two-component system response regulator HydG
VGSIALAPLMHKSIPMSVAHIPVLVVDDDREYLEALADRLESQGYRVAMAANGAEALEEISRHPPSVVVTDVEMPIMDGRELLARARARDGQLPVVVVTAESSPANDPLLDGAFRVIKKPVDPDALEAAISEAADLPRSLPTSPSPLGRLRAAARAVSNATPPRLAILMVVVASSVALLSRLRVKFG